MVLEHSKITDTSYRGWFENEMLVEDKNIRREIEKRFENGETNFLWEYDYNTCDRCNGYVLTENLLWSELIDYEDMTDEEYDKIFGNQDGEDYQSVCENCYEEIK